MKECITCKVLQPLEQYYKHSQMSDGRLGKCKECSKEQARQRRIDNPHKAREIDRKKYLKRRPEAIRSMVEYSKTNVFARIRKKACSLVASRIRTGYLERGVCEECGDKSTHGHHDSYYIENWAKVRWLCPYHHKEWHKKNKAEMPSKEECLEILK